MGSNKRDLTIGIDGDPAGFDGAAKSAEESAKAFERELGKLEREMAQAAERTKAAEAAIKKYGSESGKAALEARKLGDAAEKAGQRAERAQQAAADAADKLANGEGDAARAAELAARAEDAVEHAALKAAEAHRAAARAADEQAQQERQLARDAELAGAAQRLAAYKAAGAVDAHNAALKSLESRFGDLSKEGNGAFKSIETSSMSTFEAIASSGPGSIALVLAVLAAVPFAALAAEGAISIGLGGALAGLGLMATKSDAQVQAALHGMTDHVKTETKAIAAPFKSTWLEIARTGRDAFDGLAPELQKDFALLAPVISHFVHDAGYAVTLLGPAFGSATGAADKLLAALGPRLPDITRNLGHSISIMADSAGNAAPEFANMLVAVSQVLPPLAHLLDLAVRFGPAVSPLFNAVANGATTLDSLRGGLTLLTGGLISADHSFRTTAEQTFPSFTLQATQAADGTQHLMTAQQAAALSADELKTSMDALTGKALSQRESMYQYRKAVVDMTQALKANGSAHGFNTLKGAENEHALNNMATAAQKAAQGMRDDGKGAKEVSGFLEGARQRIIATAEKMHYSASEARALADKLLGVRDAANKIPKSKNTKVSADTGWAMSNLDKFLAKVRQIPTRRQLNVDVRYNGLRPDLQAKGGYWTPKKYARGDEVSGLLTGPGTGTSDSIPMPMLSNGEFIVNSKDTAENRDVLEAINSGHRISMGAMTAPRPISAGAVRGGDGTSITVLPPDVIVEIDGQRVFAVVQEKGREYTTRNHGRNPFATSAGG